MKKRRRKEIPNAAVPVFQVFDFILKEHAAGLRVLLGDFPFPDMVELSQMIDATMTPNDNDTKVSGGQSRPIAQSLIEKTERFYRAIASAGGIISINDAFRKLKQTNIDDWNILVDTTRVNRGRPSIFRGGYTSRLVAEKHHAHYKTIYNRRNYILREIAISLVRVRS